MDVHVGVPFKRLASVSKRDTQEEDESGNLEVRLHSATIRQTVPYLVLSVLYSMFSAVLYGLLRVRSATQETALHWFEDCFRGMTSVFQEMTSTPNFRTGRAPWTKNATVLCTEIRSS